MIISIGHFLEQRGGGAPPGDDILQAALKMGRVLLAGIAEHTVLGRIEEVAKFRRAVQALLRRLDKPPSASSLSGIASEALAALERHSRDTGEYFREENEHMQSMVAMLTESVTEIWGQQDASVARLQGIEQRIERATGLDDIRVLRDELGQCLLDLREAAAHQRGVAAAMSRHLGEQVKYTQSLAAHGSRLRRGLAGEIDLAPEGAAAVPEPAPTCYVAAFKLRRGEHIAARFGESARQQMLQLVGQSLKLVVQPEDRLLRWKGKAFVAFLTSRETLREIRSRLSEAVAPLDQQQLEVGRNSALLSVGVDWMVFPQTQCASLDAAFGEVDAFLADGALAPPSESAAGTVASGGGVGYEDIGVGR